MVRRFRVIAFLQPQDFNKSFSVTGGLKGPYKGERCASLRAAQREAALWAQSDWFAYIVRRTRTGWTLVQTMAPVAGPADWPW
jgi:hypothetical protein